MKLYKKKSSKFLILSEDEKQIYDNQKDNTSKELIV